MFELARTTQLALPAMRAQNSRKIVNISSMGGKIWKLFGAWYHATKFAVEGFSDTLRLEVKPFGIATDWVIIAGEHLAETSKGGAYEAAATKGAEALKKCTQAQV